MKISTIFQRLGILICLLGAYALGALAQSPNYKPMLQEGKEWYMRSIHQFLGDTSYVERIEGDSIVDGVTYKKLYDGNEVIGLLREEGESVFSVSDYWYMNGFFYDFSLAECDTTAFNSYLRLNVNTVDTIKVDGEPYRRLGIGCYSYDDIDPNPYPGTFLDNTAEYWVEGIGSDVGLSPLPGIEWVMSSYLVCDSCKVDGKLLFVYNDFLRVPYSSRQWVHSTYEQRMHIETHEPYWFGSGWRTYATIGETELNGKTYQKVYDCTESRCAGNDADKRYKYLFAMRNEDGRVLADAESYAAAYPKAVTEYPQNDADEFILYDYNAHVGDAYLGRADITVEQEGDTLLADGQPHRLLVLSTGHRLVEGIGCVNAGGAPFAYLCHPAYTSPVTYVTLLETYYDAEGHRVYVNTRERLCEQLLAGVEPVVSKSTARTDASAVYDLQGRRMDGRNLPKGVYIQGGRKFVVK